jgi:transposase
VADAGRPARGRRPAADVSPHLSTAKDHRAGEWAAASNSEIAYTPTNSSWLNRVEAQFTALRYFALNGLIAIP